MTFDGLLMKSARIVYQVVGWCFVEGDLKSLSPLIGRTIVHGPRICYLRLVSHKAIPFRECF